MKEGHAEFYAVTCEMETFCSSMECESVIPEGSEFILMRLPDGAPFPKGDYDLCEKCFTKMTGMNLEYLKSNARRPTD